MASKTSIISGASIRLGNDPVISLDEGSKAAQVGANLYAPVLESLLTAHRWRFATGKMNLSLLADSPLNEWAYAYQLPTNPKVMHIIRVYPATDYERFENKLYCDTGAGIAIDYVYRPSEEYFPPSFVDLLEYKMAMEMAIPITGSASLREQFKADIVGNGLMPGVLGYAMAADSRERPADSIIDSPFIDVRR